MHTPLTRTEILDLDFIEARHKLIDIAAFLDRCARAEGRDDFRMKAFRNAMQEACKPELKAAERVLLIFSDPTPEPISAATTQGATGAWQQATPAP
jgi:hypothetical protein